MRDFRKRYSKSQDDKNNEIEGVAKQTTFQKGYTAHLDHKNDVSNTAISNFVFHEVKIQPNKTALMKEALWVIKSGGTFTFDDVLYSKSNYSDLVGMIQVLSKEVTEIHCVYNVINQFAHLALTNYIL